MAYFKQTPREEQHQPVFTAPIPEDTDYEDEPLAEDGLYLSEEEEAELARRDRWKVAANVADFFGVLVGVLVILLLIALLISLINWVAADMTQSFTLLQAWI